MLIGYDTSVIWLSRNLDSTAQEKPDITNIQAAMTVSTHTYCTVQCLQFTAVH